MTKIDTDNIMSSLFSYIQLFFPQDEKNQILTTNVWLNLVSVNAKAQEMTLFALDTHTDS